MFRKAAMAAALAAALGTSASAATITQTQGFIGQPNFDKVVEFERFDPALGTLQSVEWRFNLAINGGTLTVDNDGPLPAEVNVKLGATGALSSDDVRLLDDTFTNILSGGSALDVSTGTVFTLEGDNGDGMTFDPTMPDADTHVGGAASTSGSGFVNSTFFDDYLGTDYFGVTADLNQLLDFGGIGGISGQFDPVTADSNITLIYQYVPEPGTGISMLLGLGLLLHGCRRRHQA